MSKVPDFLSQGAVVAARQLVGWRLYVKETDGSLTGGMIVETEAYTMEDAASHSYRGQTPRNSVMFGPPGYIYVYFTYGMHWCMNIVTGTSGQGEAVLIRSITPDKGLETVRRRRRGKPDTQLTNGPAKVCQALAVAGQDSGSRLGTARFTLEPPVKTLQEHIRATPRIGITHDTHRLWRFLYVEGEL